ncbi:MAG: UDP-3-O-acyl-N-acetylglucosamine deacetylase [Scytolyngbya sp. HA4215-MV1]|jgi:UDP-3-O-[3-hydroxymyristoyl] N-acetylglucosamine deacetylase|nr:UDP-3-O-acyl-N-acetylglucosamine deacetylase [Scytolyngbya sp. HA4215-MV1]
MQSVIQGHAAIVYQPESNPLLKSQQTLKEEVVLSGVGLHTGLSTSVRLLPADVGRGRYFVRVDLPNAPEIAATVESVSQTVLSTELTAENSPGQLAQVRTVEHLLAALAGMGVDNVRIEVDGAELPLLDGSAQPWVRAIAQVGLIAQSLPQAIWQLAEPLWIHHGDAFVAALPAPETRFTYGIDFDLPAIGNQWHSWSVANDESFATEIAPARTFGLAHQIDQLKAQGLIKGGSLENALVCGSEGWINPPLRFSNEPVRHKLLDLVGDLSLLGSFPLAHFLAYKASHHLHSQMVRLLVQRMNHGKMERG